MAAHLWRELKGKKCQRKPRSQVWPDPTNLSVAVELADHRVGELERTDSAVAQHNASRPVPKFFAPAQPLHASVHGAQENSQIVASSEHQASREGRDQFRVRGQRGDEPVDVIVFRGGPVASYGVVHNPECPTAQSLDARQVLDFRG
jgi:hypothetical protein